jgi:K+-sensing histidine kinase KdpD
MSTQFCWNGLLMIYAEEAKESVPMPPEVQGRGPLVPDTIMSMFEYVMSVAVVALCSAIAVALRARFDPPTFAMLYLLGVVGVSMRCRRSAAVLNAFASVTAFYYFSVPYNDSFVLQDSNYLITLVAMLVVALVISTLTFKVRAQAAKVIEAEIAFKTEQSRNSLLSAVSHDIKTPLASIYGAATSLLEEEQRFEQAERHELIQSIADEAQRLNHVVTNLLEMTRLDAGAEIKRDWYPLEEIIGGALSRLETALRGRTVMTSISPSLPLICVDEVLIEQVFINILENAVNYTPPGSPIEITAELEGANIIVLVRDSGPGFRQGEELRVFEKFVRGGTNNIRGAGLGLPIARAILQRHEGTISASNSRRGGAILTIELPIGGIPPRLQPAAEGTNA